jgi:hypothetical protein
VQRVGLHHQVRLSPRRRPVRPLLGVPEALLRAVGELNRRLEPARLEGRLVERDQSRGEAAPVLEEGVHLAGPVLVHAEEASSLELPVEHGASGTRRALRPLRPLEDPAAKASPRIISPFHPASTLSSRPEAPLRPLGKEPRADTVEPATRLVLRAPGGARQVRQRHPALEHAPPVLEGSLRRHPERCGRTPPVLRAEHRLQLGRTPDEVLALLALAVGILRGVERAGRVGHLPAEPLHQARRGLRPLHPRGDLLRLGYRE